MSHERIQQLMERMRKADDSFAGEYARKRAGTELLNFADKLEAFAAKKPLTKVAFYCKDRAKRIRDFVAYN